MARRAFLHIGPPKSGTTYVQEVLWSNKKRLAKSGITLPLNSSQSHRVAAWTLCADAHDQPNRERWNWDRVAAQAASTDDTLLFSAERLAAAGPDPITHAIETLAPADVHVITTVRDLGRQLPSLWQQLVKQRHGRTLDEFLTDARDEDSNIWRWQDVPSILGRWLVHVPPERIHVVTVPPPGAPNAELWSRFAGVLGLTADSFRLPEEMRNTSLDAVEAEVLRRFNRGLGERMPMRAPYYRAVRSWFVPALAECGDGTKRVELPAAHASWVAERSDRMRRELEQLDVDLAGDWDDLVSVVPAAVANPVTTDETLETSLEVLRRLVARNAELTEQLAAARTRTLPGAWSAVRGRLARLRAR
jgi:hypothetical protein